LRITNSMMTNKFLTESNEALNRVSKYQTQVDSSKRLNSIADDPQGTLLALKARNKLSNLDLYKSNISTATSYLTEAETSTSALNEVIQSAYEDVISAQSATTSDDKAVLAEDIKNLQAEVLSISNSSMGTSYLFGGFNYTGSTSGTSKSPPFSVDSVTGDLTYNGINLSQISWQEDFTDATASMSDSSTSIAEYTTAFASSSNDTYAKEQAQSALDALNSLVSSAKEAMSDAVEYGVDPSSTNYTEFKTFYDNISAAATALNTEVSKDVAGDYILDTAATQLNTDGTIDYDYYTDEGISVLTSDELANKFSISSTQTALDNVASYLTGVPSTMDNAITNLSGDVTISADVQTALADEADNKTSLQIGTAQTVDMTFTGLDLLGTGSNNVYHILGKAVQMLTDGASSDELSEMLTSLQSAQSSVLTLETKIGGTQNRLSLITSRYESSELNYTGMKSDAEDADMAEAIVNLTTAQTVYNAALAGGAEIIKTSLIDFLQ